ncbi:hypothetical protein [Rheinheimera muenzenbergensis]
MPTPLLPRPLPKAVWFVLLYLAGVASLTLLALLLKGLLNGL